MKEPSIIPLMPRKLLTGKKYEITFTNARKKIFSNHLGSMCSETGGACSTRRNDNESDSCSVDDGKNRSVWKFKGYGVPYLSFYKCKQL
jgi:hypothetical protein